MEHTLLVADDVEMNRELLAAIFGSDYAILQASNGQEALDIVRERPDTISAMLLDLIMPVKDGMAVLREMNEEGLISRVPVLVVGGEIDADIEKRCNELGVSDFIPKPVDPIVARLRVKNVVNLHMYRRHLEEVMASQSTRVLEDRASLELRDESADGNYENIVSMMGDFIEARCNENGRHVVRIKGYTEILANAVAEMFPEYGLSRKMIQTIVTVCPLHDVGKITIPDAVLFKPGALTPDERRIMQDHTIKGCELLDRTAGGWGRNSSSNIVAHEICRWHHERWDGSDYPDGLKGDSIPISAQIVSLADVYEALIHNRVYRNSLSLDNAYAMIMDGRCGVFSPKLLKCFTQARMALEEFANQEIVYDLFNGNEAADAQESGAAADGEATSVLSDEELLERAKQAAEAERADATEDDAEKIGIKDAARDLADRVERRALAIKMKSDLTFDQFKRDVLGIVEKEREDIDTFFMKRNLLAMRYVSIVMILTLSFWAFMGAFASPFESLHALYQTGGGVLIGCCAVVMLLYSSAGKRKSAGLYRFMYLLFSLVTAAGVGLLTSADMLDVAGLDIPVVDMGLSFSACYMLCFALMPSAHAVDALLFFCIMLAGALVPKYLPGIEMDPYVQDYIFRVGLMVLYFYYNRNLRSMYASQESQRDSADEILRASYIDRLTGVLNRRALDDYAAKVGTIDNMRHVGIIMFDIDDFKHFNDHCSHAKGDWALASVCEAVVLSHDGARPYLFRYGGEEFVMIVENTVESELVKIGCAVREAVWNYDIKRSDGTDYSRITITVGCAIETVESIANGTADFIRMADEQLYIGKREAKNCTVMNGKVYR